MTELPQEVLHKTPMGTLIRKNWQKPYYEKILRVERVTRHAICGSPKKNYEPCRQRPQEQYGFGCRLHKYNLDDEYSSNPDFVSGSDSNNSTNGLYNPSGVSVENYEREKGLFKHIMPQQYFRKNFSRCNVCNVKAECAQNLVDSHCRIEEDMFYQFLESIRHDYDIQDFTQVDMFMIYNAAFRWLNGIVLQINQNLYSPTNDDVIRIQIAAVRESKEFRETMQKLGLTRDARQKMRRKDFQIGISTAQAVSKMSIANLMAEEKRKQNAETQENK